jgi:hypothetical protein
MGGFSGPDRHEEHVGPGQSARGDVAPRSLVRVRPAALPRLSLRWCDAFLEASLRELEVWVAADGGKIVKKRAPFRTSSRI